LSVCYPYPALAGAMILGRRKSHLANQTQQPSNIPYVMLGTGMLWFGWFGFNAGSALKPMAPRRWPSPPPTPPAQPPCWAGCSSTGS
jgi:hypothetical protein